MKICQSKKNAERSKLIDRVAVVILSGSLAFLTFGLLWLIISGIPYGGEGIFLPFYFIWIPSLFFALLGIFTMEDIILKLLSRMWYFIYVAFGGEPSNKTTSNRL